MMSEDTDGNKEGGAVGHLLQRVIGRVNQAERVLIEFQMDHAAFVVDRAGSAILYCLGHVINVDVIAEHLSGIAVFDGNRRARKADKGGVRECVVQNTCVADYNSSARMPPFNRFARILSRITSKTAQDF